LLVTKIFLIKGLNPGDHIRKEGLFGHYFLIPMLFLCYKCIAFSLVFQIIDVMEKPISSSPSIPSSLAI
jgi:hypothetical protein